jgi:5-(carboxyamino)imidazole ribonucleotide mutase
MPGGVPVATVALNGGKNAGLLAAQVLGSSDLQVAERLQKYKDELREKVEEAAQHMEENGYKGNRIGFSK